MQRLRDLSDLLPRVNGQVSAINQQINLAAFGNMVPHLHWHIIPRWRDDKHFPEPIWGKVARPDARPAVDAVSSPVLADRLKTALADAGYGAC